MPRSKQQSLSPGIQRAFAVLDLQSDQARRGNARIAAKQADKLATSANHDSEVNFAVDFFI